MTHTEAERAVKLLQKEFLLWVEEHPVLATLDADTFEEVRHRVFRSTFYSFRLGVVGLDKVKPGLWRHFFGWLDSHPAMLTLDLDTVNLIADRCFTTALEAFRVGALVASTKPRTPEEAPNGTHVHDG
jgi:hypothetical protein